VSIRLAANTDQEAEQTERCGGDRDAAQERRGPSVPAVGARSGDIAEARGDRAAERDQRQRQHKAERCLNGVLKHGQRTSILPVCAAGLPCEAVLDFVERLPITESLRAPLVLSTDASSQEAHSPQGCLVFVSWCSLTRANRFARGVRSNIDRSASTLTTRVA